MAEQLHGDALIHAGRRLQEGRANNSDTIPAYDGILHTRNPQVVRQKTSSIERHSFVHTTLTTITVIRYHPSLVIALSQALQCNTQSCCPSFVLPLMLHSLTSLLQLKLP